MRTYHLLRLFPRQCLLLPSLQTAVIKHIPTPHTIAMITVVMSDDMYEDTNSFSENMSQHLRGEQFT